MYLISPTPGTRKIANSNSFYFCLKECVTGISHHQCVQRCCGDVAGILVEPLFMVGGLWCLVRGQESLCTPQAADRPLCYRKSRPSLGWKGKECSLSGELVGLSTRRFFKPQMTNLANVVIVQPQHQRACLHSSPQTPASSCAQVLSVKCSRLCCDPGTSQTLCLQVSFPNLALLLYLHMLRKDIF